jgi:hypothetical protein
MTGAVAPKAGMTISIRTRRDVVVVDPDRFLAAARQALRDRNPGLTDAEAAEAVVDVHDAVHALLDRDGALAADAVDGEAVGIGGLCLALGSATGRTVCRPPVGCNRWYSTIRSRCRTMAASFPLIPLRCPVPGAG